MNKVAAKIPGKWRDVGLQLGVDQSILDGIASISPGDTNLCYSKVFTQWKNQTSTTNPAVHLVNNSSSSEGFSSWRGETGRYDKNKLTGN